MEDSKSLRTRSVKVSTSMTIGSSRRISTSTSTRPTLGLKSPFPACQSPRTCPNSGYPFAHRGLLTNVLRKLGRSHRVQITDSCRSSCRLVRKTVQQDRLFPTSLLVSRISQANDASRDTLHAPERDARTPLADFIDSLSATVPSTFCR